MKKKLYIPFGIAIILIICVYNYIYKNHRNISEEAAAYSITAKDLINEFTTNNNTIQKKYLNKTIEIKGNISAIDKNTITINDAVFCTMTGDFNSSLYDKSDIILVKGRLIGYDDLLEEIKLDQCSIIN